MTLSERRTADRIRSRAWHEQRRARGVCHSSTRCSREPELNPRTGQPFWLCRQCRLARRGKASAMKFDAVGRPPLTILELRAIGALLAADGPLTVGELRAALGLELEDMGEVLDALRAFDLVTRIADPDGVTR